MGDNLFENARKTKINFNQIAGREIGVLVIFRFSFDLYWPFKTLEYTRSIVFFS